MATNAVFGAALLLGSIYLILYYHLSSKVKPETEAQIREWDKGKVFS